ncbi:MAG TPA: peptide ABC transporter substrate-binding protein [Thermomicrobiales bacterium]|nr:peptide ABC transporter substrate-binding protein [Thermomicrobiales bacterium]
MGDRSKWWEDEEQARRFRERFAAVNLPRRELLKIVSGAGGALAVSAFLAACGDDDDDDDSTDDGDDGGAQEQPTPTTAEADEDEDEATEPDAEETESGGEEGGEEDGELAEEQVFRTNLERDPLHFDYNKDLYAAGDAAVVGMLGMFDVDYAAVPDIAESWEANEDFSVWTFHIREGTGWSNGDPITAHDYEWSWKRQLDPATVASYANFLYDIKNAEAFNTGQDGVTIDDVGVRAVDDYTLEVEMEAPASYFPIVATYVAAAPAHRASVEAHGDDWTDPNLVDEVVCSGPFKLVQWDHDQLVVLEKNEHYWNADNITLTRIERPIISSDASQLAYENGEIDWHWRGQLGQLERVQNDPTLSKEMLPFNTFGSWYLVPDPNFEPFHLKEVRLAMAHAIDRETICEAVLRGLGEPAYTLMPPGTPHYDPNTYEEYTAYDPELAMSLLEGTPYEGGKNWPAITLTHREEGDAPKAAAEAIINMLRENLGMDIEHEIGEPEVTYERMYNHEIQLMWVRWYIDYPDANNYLYQVWYSKTPTGHRHSFESDEFDEYVTQAKSVAEEERLQWYQKANEVLAREAACIPVYYIYAYGLMKPYVTNLPRNSNGEFTPGWNVFIRDYDYYQILKH